MLSRASLNIALAASVTLASAVLLIALRLELPLVGGAGQPWYCPAVDLANSGDGRVTDPPVQRGEILRSGADEYKKFQLCDGTLLYLDHNTEIVLSAYPHPELKQQTQLTLLQGRLVLDGVADVRARNVVVSSLGSGCELTHYSWKDELAVTALTERGCLVTSEMQTQNPTPTGATQTFETYKGELLSTSKFAPLSSSAASFYLWTELEFETLP